MLSLRCIWFHLFMVIQPTNYVSFTSFFYVSCSLSLNHASCTYHNLWFHFYQGMKKLESLNLDSCKIGDRGIANLAGMFYLEYSDCLIMSVWHATFPQWLLLPRGKETPGEIKEQLFKPVILHLAFSRIIFVLGVYYLSVLFFPFKNLYML